MAVDFIPLISFVIVTTFTPGPNNISCASMGVLHGYGRTLGYISGIVSGFFLVMMACALLSGVLLAVIPSVEIFLRLAGSVYILYLAAASARASYAFRETGEPPLAFGKGFLLQPLNPKVAVYGLTVYSTFLSSVSGHPVFLVISAILLATVAFCATSTWALFGAAIRKYLHRPVIRKSVNAILSLLLVYTAVELSCVLDWIG